nr:patatin-like phospholipase family protein [Microvirga makkahensis]
MKGILPLKSPRPKRTTARRRTGTSAVEGRLALVLAGGNALGAFEAGAYQALHDQGFQPDWVVGSSIGAVNGAIIAGNPPERRADALRTFWSKVSWPTGSGSAPDGLVNVMQRLAGQMQTASFGNLAMFLPSPTGFMASEMKAIGLYDLAPLRDTLEHLVDFDLLNEGPVRLTMVAVDLETGDEVLFDTRSGRLGPEHIIASNALVPDFKPVEIDGRLLGDGGLSANLPIDVVRREPDGGRLCIAVELFSARRPPSTSFAEAVARRQELLFANQSRWFLEAHAREDRVRSALRVVAGLIPDEVRNRPEIKTALAEADRPDMRLVTIAGDPDPETGNWFYDYSEQAIRTRWQAGEAKARAALQAPVPAGAPQEQRKTAS